VSAGPVAVEGDCCAGSQGAARVQVLERTDGLVRLRVDADAATTVVIDQAYYPGWKADVDGAQTDIRPANIVNLSVRVAAGGHEFSLRYARQSVLVGGILTLLGMAALGGLLILERVRREHGLALLDDYYRSLGRIPDYLAAAWNAIQPLVGDTIYLARASALAEEATRIAARLLAPPATVGRQRD